MIQYLENNSAKKSKFWQIEAIARSVTIHFGIIGNDGIFSTTNFETENEVFTYYKNQILKKFKSGYIDPENKVDIARFQDSTFDRFLNVNDFENAIDWLENFDDLYIASNEDKLINAHIDNKKLIEVQRYIFNKIKIIKSVDIIIRQIRYLSKIDPLMCRVMIGNMPVKPQSINLKQYYQDFAIAQSGIGMLNASEVTLNNINDKEVKIIYLAHLLDTYHQQSELQISILNNAITILESADFNSSTKNTFYLLLSKGAITIDQKEISERLYETAQYFKVQDNA